MNVPCLRSVILPRARGILQPREKIIIPYHNVQIDVHPGDDRSRTIRRITAGNLIPAAGRNLMALLLANRAFAPSSICVGTDGTAADAPVALGAEVYRAPIDTRKVSGSTITYQLFLASTVANGNTLREAAIFAGENWYQGVVSPGGGTLFARVVFTPIEKTSAVSLTLRWEIPVSSN